jgi:hypothetical protein
MIQKELLNELSKQSDTYRTIAGTLETGKAQVIDVFDEPPSPSGFGGGTKIVLRKPIDEKESNGKAKKSKAEV